MSTRLGSSSCRSARLSVSTAGCVDLLKSHILTDRSWTLEVTKVEVREDRDRLEISSE
jgi:hypothetical protein